LLLFSCTNSTVTHAYDTYAQRYVRQVAVPVGRQTTAVFG